MKSQADNYFVTEQFNISSKEETKTGYSEQYSLKQDNTRQCLVELGLRPENRDSAY